MKISAASLTDPDDQAARPWWEPPYVVYAFSDRRVRSLLERLMGTNVVRVTDRNFMLKLQSKRREDHEERLMNRIRQRELGEADRIKGLILEGKMPAEEAPEELSDHPVIRIRLDVKRILLERKLKRKKRRMKKAKGFDYNLLGAEEIEEEDDAEIRSCMDVVTGLAARNRTIRDHDEYVSGGMEDIAEEDYGRIKYEDGLVADLYELEGVDEMYELADEIVGLLTGKGCGGLRK